MYTDTDNPDAEFCIDGDTNSSEKCYSVTMTVDEGAQTVTFDVNIDLNLAMPIDGGFANLNLQLSVDNDESSGAVSYA